MDINLSTMSQMATTKPKKKASTPKVPKKCIGRLENFPTKKMDSKSRKPLTKRLRPNLVVTYLRTRWATTCSPMRSEEHTSDLTSLMLFPYSFLNPITTLKLVNHL